MEHDYREIKARAAQVLAICERAAEEEEARQKWAAEHPRPEVPMTTRYRRRGNWGGPRPGGGRPPRPAGSKRHSFFATDTEWQLMKAYLRAMRAAEKEQPQAEALAATSSTTGQEGGFSPVAISDGKKG